MSSRATTLSDMNALAEQGGGADQVKKQHERGRLTARERIDALLDTGTFIELDKLRIQAGSKRYGEGVVTGHGFVDGRQVFVFAQDATVEEGTLTKVQAEKICKVIDLARQVGAPIVGLWDGNGPRISEGVSALAGYGDLMLRHMMASGVVPQLAAVLGSTLGSGAFGPAIADFTLMSAGSTMFTIAPEVVKAITNENVSAGELGGAQTHAESSGVAHVVAANDGAVIDKLRELLAYLPSNNAEDPPRVEFNDDPERKTKNLATLIPESPNKPYDMKQVITAAMDDGRFFEIHEGFAKNMLVGFARLCGRPIGIIANQPAHLAGCIDANACVKAARFVRFCDVFNIPLVTFVDAPGFLPSREQERMGLIRQGAKLMYAYAEATVPKVTVFTRKAYGDAYVAMGSKHVRADLTLAFPSAEIAVAQPETAVAVLHKAELAQSADKEALKKKLVGDYRESHANPFRAAELGYVDEIIQPEMLRPHLVRAVGMLRDKRQQNPPRKHGNIPL